MDNLLDMILMAIAVLAGLRGFRRGLFGSLAGLLGYIGAFWLAGRYDTTMAVWINQKWRWNESVQAWIQPMLPGSQWTSNPVQMLPLDAVSRMLLLALSFTLVFMLSRFILGMAGGLISSLLQAVPVVGTLDKLGGLAIGLLEGVLMAMFFAFMLLVSLPFIHMSALDRLAQSSDFMQLAKAILEHYTPLMMEEWNKLSASWISAVSWRPFI